MALNIRTVMTYPLDGSNVNFTITFEYLARKFITVTLIGTDRKELILNQDYRFTSKNQITLTKAWGPSDGYANIEIRRFTSATERLVDFADGSILRAYDLNISQVQTLHVAEEARDLTADTIGVNNDGNLDARGRRIVNLADGVDVGDAVTVRQQQNWADSALNQANRSKQEADRSEAAANRSSASASAALASEQKAKTSENNAQVSETNAKTSETNAKTSENLASASSSSAKVSETNSKTSETNSKASEERAILEAGKLGNMNDFAATIKTVTGNDVVMKGKFSVDNGLQSNAGITYLNVNTATITALRTQGDIEVFPPIGGQPNGEGGQMRLKGADGGNTGGFIDVDSVGTLRIVKEGSGAGLKVSFDTAGNMLVHSNFYALTGGVKLNSSGTVVLGPDGNIESSIYKDGNIHADLNKRILQGENRRLVATDIWFGDLTGAGPWDIGPVDNMVGGTLGIKVNKDGEDLWLVLSMSPFNDMKYTLAGRGSLSVDIRIWGGTQIEITRVTNCDVRQLQLWK
ncbi:tail fiber protein [Yersinia phage fPS-53]|uniref:Tail fibers n=3 Tax=Helsettvirus fPS53 TaxID=2733626 RepID=A0A2H1UJ90_9CAUD|nr:tail fiber protein [Yersinia phage fPS-53]SOO46625.1 Phage tail fibers [Yersinia phage fPS-89]SOO56457.1 tail fibers [Yersinia phage fPS-85]SOO56508.1 tail fibers [Yersinia phage fPS-53]